MSGTGRRLAHRWLQAVFLLAVWCALWGQVTWANVASGLLVVGLALWWIPRPDRTHRVHPLALVRFGLTFLWLLVTSSAAVAVTVLRPTPPRLRAGVVACPLRTDDPLVATIVADAITLTPGTLTLDVRSNPSVLEVHVLGLGEPDEVRADVARLEDLVVRAVTPADPGDGSGDGRTGRGRSR